MTEKKSSSLGLAALVIASGVGTTGTLAAPSVDTQFDVASQIAQARMTVKDLVGRSDQNTNSGIRSYLASRSGFIKQAQASTDTWRTNWGNN